MVKSLSYISFELVSLGCLKHRESDGSSQIMSQPKHISRAFADTSLRFVQRHRNHSDARIQLGPPTLKVSVESPRVYRLLSHRVDALKQLLCAWLVGVNPLEL